MTDQATEVLPGPDNVIPLNGNPMTEAAAAPTETPNEEERSTFLDDAPASAPRLFALYATMMEATCEAFSGVRNDGAPPREDKATIIDEAIADARALVSDDAAVVEVAMQKVAKLTRAGIRSFEQVTARKKAMNEMMDAIKAQADAPPAPPDPTCIVEGTLLRTNGTTERVKIDLCGDMVGKLLHAREVFIVAVENASLVCVRTIPQADGNGERNHEAEKILPAAHQPVFGDVVVLDSLGSRILADELPKEPVFATGLLRYADGSVRGITVDVGRPDKLGAELGAPWVKSKKVGDTVYIYGRFAELSCRPVNKHVTGILHANGITGAVFGDVLEIPAAEFQAGVDKSWEHAEPLQETRSARLAALEAELQKAQG